MASAIYVGPNGDLRRDVWITPSKDRQGCPTGEYDVNVRNPLDPDGEPMIIETTPHYWHAECVADHWNSVEF